MRLCGLVEGFMAPDEDLPFSVLCVLQLFSTDLVAVQNMALSPIEVATREECSKNSCKLYNRFEIPFSLSQLILNKAFI